MRAARTPELRGTQDCLAIALVAALYLNLPVEECGRHSQKADESMGSDTFVLGPFTVLGRETQELRFSQGWELCCDLLSWEVFRQPGSAGL